MYSVSKGKWVDKSFYKALKGEDPPAEGKIRIDDGDQFHDVDPNHCVYYDSSFQSTFDYSLQKSKGLLLLALITLFSCSLCG